MEPTTREGGLLAWQYAEYPAGHRDRRNLIVHILTWPLFVGGGLSMIANLATGHYFIALASFFAMPLVVVAQGMTHRLERQPPHPFRGPLDVIGRIFAEQWITFPRFVLSGGFARAWREATEPR